MPAARRKLPWVLVLALFASLAVPVSAAGIIIPLDGTWAFKLDPNDAGQREGWFSSTAVFPHNIKVPGAWQAQGYGAESDKLHHAYSGRAWYKRHVTLPRLNVGERLFLCIGAVHRSAEVWCNGKYLGEHTGYLSALEFELTAEATNPTATIVICVDSRQDWNRDCLTGCVDIIDEMFTTWGGIWGHISLQVRRAAWLEDISIAPVLGPERCTVSGKIAGHLKTAESLNVEVLSPNGRIASRTEMPCGASNTWSVTMEIPNAELWSPESPVLYRARISLSGKGGLLAQDEIPLGIRVIETRGSRLLLNGQALFLRGYGDDAIYPRTMAPPTDKEYYRRRLQVAKSYGFNYVRHHSHVLPPEYYAAADEVGMLISAEFPIAYQEYYNKAAGPALELYKTEWAAMIRQLRNHPSIMDWCMGNELYQSTPIGPELYRIAKQLNPGRLVIDSDGLSATPFTDRGGDRPTLDFFSVQFDENALPLDRPGKHHTSAPKKPVISHETGNYATLPRLDLLGLFQDNFRPFWLQDYANRVRALGLRSEARQWSWNSEQLYCLAHKLNLEDLRKNPQLSGYTWWLLQDYWTGSNGLLDTYRRPKSIAASAVREFNAPAVLLQEGLGLAYLSGESVRVKVLVSNYASAPVTNGTLSWRWGMKGKMLGHGRKQDIQVGQGEVVLMHEIEVPAPNVSEPGQLKLETVLTSNTTSARNHWQTWIFPEPKRIRQPGAAIYAARDLVPMLAKLDAQVIPATGELPSHAVHVVRQPTARILSALEAGASVVCLAPANLLASQNNRFKPAWWLGSANDCNVGTAVYRTTRLRVFAPEGWADAGWYRLLEGAQAFVLDEIPFSKPVGADTVLVRALDVHTHFQNKALVFQARVGHGTIIVSGLKLEPLEQAPEREWVLSTLIEHARKFPEASATISASFLREALGATEYIIGPCVPGFQRLTSTNCETAEYMSYRGSNAQYFICRELGTNIVVAWATAPVPAQIKKTVTFVFGGALGWRSQSAAGGFALSCQGTDALHFDLSNRTRAWTNAHGVRLLFVPRKQLPEDSLGVFYLTLPADGLTPGEPVHLQVRSLGRTVAAGSG